MTELAFTLATVYAIGMFLATLWVLNLHGQPRAVRAAAFIIFWPVVLLLVLVHVGIRHVGSRKE